MKYREKCARLRERILRAPRWAVSLSGGVDSVFLLHVMAETLGAENVLAVTARGRNFPAREFAEAARCAELLGVEHLTLEFEPLDLAEFVENGPERCYYCKRALFSAIIGAARERGYVALADGANADDVGDYRPGMRATRELGVASPLLEAGIGKAEIREGLRERGAALWRKPSFACLASRIPYGTAIDGEALARVERAENFFLDDLGFVNIRVRHHGDVARLEAEERDRARLADPELAGRVYDALLKLGYKYVALDLRGYRSGSMNEGLPGDVVE